ncbi:nucleoside diphosphate kinase-like [Plodia interpunctella]|uniref:nucleoside diphosphate kinase-like n=1 Tax=Plodia interpunctella TaxID=58824 RepID=UPI002368A4B0|nr:nucleoside diphosphate kinase-like [Plodia interpunctella]
MRCKIIFSFIVPTLLFIVNAFHKKQERTFIMIKPDGVQRGLIGSIIKRFEDKGFKLIAMKFIYPKKQHLLDHYIKLIDKPFFKELIKYMSSGPIVPMVWEGKGIVEKCRAMIGATDPGDAAPGTVRGDLSVDVARNVIHGSDSVEAAQKEVQLWFPDEEFVKWTPENVYWIYDVNKEIQ